MARIQLASLRFGRVEQLLQADGPLSEIKYYMAVVREAAAGLPLNSLSSEAN